MPYLKFVCQAGAMLLRGVTVDLVPNLVETIRRLIALIKAFCARKKLPHPIKTSSGNCVTVSHPAFRRADPCIYSQSYLMKLGLPVTWDNPDILLRKNGVVVPEHDLEPGTEYEIEATIWNNSYDAPVIGMKVDFSFLSFGVATVSTPIGSTNVSVGVKGGANHPARTRIPWTTPATGGHFCLQVKLNWFDDANQENNFGQNNLDVALAQSPAHFTFVLRNPFPRAHRFHFEVDTYTPLQPPDCDVEPFPREPRSARIRRVLERHQVEDFSVPLNWTVAISPEPVSLNPGEEATIQVDITPPPGFSGEKAFNVNAFGDEIFAGGVTLVVWVP
jgi:hypothetical protein